MRFIAPASLATLCLLVCDWAIGSADVAAAPPGANQAFVSNEVTTFKGKLKGMKGNIVLVEKEDGAQAMVALPDSIASFQFIAKATPAFLKRGMMVRVVGTFGPTGLPVTPITKVTLFQPVPPQSVQGRAREQFMPGVHTDSKQPRQRNQPMMGKMTIVGSLIGLSPQGILALQAGKTPVRIPLTMETQLEVRYNNLSLAQEGDPVNVSGFYNPPNENQVKADRITVTTDRVYGEYQPKPNKTRRGKKPAADEPEKPNADGGQPENSKPESDAEMKENAEQEKPEEAGGNE